MPIIIDNKKKFIMDRTVPELIKEVKISERRYLYYFIELLKKIGVDMIEINEEAITKFGELPSNINYAYRIKSQDELQIIRQYGFKQIIVNCKSPENLIGKINKENIILEVDLKDIHTAIRRKWLRKPNISCVVITGAEECNYDGWGEIINSIKKNFLSQVGFCASNKYFMATAISIESIEDGADFISVAFNGERYGFSSLEEVIMALRVIKKASIGGELKFIRAAVELYEKLTHKNIYSMKPVLGKDIFNYESGIHVDGIEKNPKTYEPFNPQDIGTERKMFIGKHSGKKAVMTKLLQLRVQLRDVNMDDFLSEVRKSSILLRRNLFDDELVKLYKNF